MSQTRLHSDEPSNNAYFSEDFRQFLNYILTKEPFSAKPQRIDDVLSKLSIISSKSANSHFSSSLETGHIQPLEKTVKELKDKCMVLESRVESLEFQNNISPIKNKIDKIEEFLATVFGEVLNITRLYYTPTSDGLTLIIIHTFDKTSEALPEIRKCIFRLKQVYPEIFFEPWVLHTSEIKAEHLYGSKNVFGE